MKKFIIFFILIFFIGCSLPAEYHRGDELIKQGDYIGAINSYEAAAHKAGSDSQRKQIKVAIEKTKEKLVDDLIDKAAKIYTRNESPTVIDADEAIATLEKGIKYENFKRELSAKIKDYRKNREYMLSEVEELIKDANVSVKNEEFNNALQLLYKAQKINPSSKSIKTKIQKLESFSDKRQKYYKEQIREYLNQGKGDKAKSIFKKLQLIVPDDPQLPDLGQNIEDVHKKQILKTTSLLGRQNKWYRAYQLLLKTDDEGLNDEISKVRDKGSKYYYEKADSYFKKGDIHQAYIAAFKAAELGPEDIMIFKLQKECDDLIEKEIQKYIAIPTFNAPANEPDAGMLFSDALIVELFPVLPYGLHIVEREKIDILMDNKNMELKTISSKLGLDIIITGNVALYKVEKDISERVVSSRVKVGEEEKTNPELNKFTEEYGRNKRRWPYIPPNTIMIDKYDVVKYKKGTISLTAYGSMTIRIFDTEQASIVYVKNFEDSIKITDNFQDSVEGTNIVYDPAEIKTETELKKELLDKIIKTSAKEISLIFKDREQRFLKWATQKMERKEYSNALKYLVQGHLYCKRTEGKSEGCDKITQLIVDLTEGY